MDKPWLQRRGCIYTFNWGGYNPESLEAGSYELIVTDDNLCQQSLPFLITEPSDFSLELTSGVPDCADPNSGSIHVNVVGYGGPVDLDWGGVDPDMVPAGVCHCGHRHVRVQCPGFSCCAFGRDSPELRIERSGIIDPRRR